MLSGKKYISSKRASGLTGYAQDYIGQLARGGAIDAQRIGGLWYVSLESLKEHQGKEDGRTPPARTQTSAPAHDQFVAFDGKDYVSASRAAELTGYNQDYVGQLARSGKILSRQVGNRWYVERSGILAHKEQKDALLAAVQAESVGLAPLTAEDGERSLREEPAQLQYIQEQSVFLPSFTAKGKVSAAGRQEEDYGAASHVVPIKKVPSFVAHNPAITPVRTNRVHGKTISKAVLSASMLTVVIVLSFGLTFFGVSTMYAMRSAPGAATPVPSNTMVASAAAAAVRIGDIVERMVSPEIMYTRHQ